MKKVVIQGEMTPSGQRKWEILNANDDKEMSMLEKLKIEADSDLRKFCQDKAVELLSGNITLGGEIYRCDWQPTLEILKFLIELSDGR